MEDNAPTTTELRTHKLREVRLTLTREDHDAA